MRRGRLLKLAAFLETVPAKAFSINSWQARKATKREGKRPGTCGFAGCAVGWAAHAKLIPGLTLRGDFCGVWPDYEGLRGFMAVQKAFDISRFQAELLFIATSYPGRDPTPQEVANAIRNFVKTEGFTTIGG